MSANWSQKCTSDTPRTGPKTVSAPSADGRILLLQGQSPHQQESKTAETWVEAPPQPIALAPSQYIAGLEMPGEGTKGPKCGSVQSKTACPVIAEGSKSAQLPGAKPHSVAVTPFFCKSPRCPTCWPIWLKRAAMRGEERIAAAQALYPYKDRRGVLKQREARHFTFSPPQKETVMQMRREGVSCLPNMHRKAYATIRRAGIEGGLVVFHPWRCSGKGPDRYRKTPRQLAPHYHVIGLGYTTKSSEFYAKTGWLLKNHNAAREKRFRSHGIHAPPLKVSGLLHYLLDHCGLVVAGVNRGDGPVSVKGGRRTGTVAVKDALRAFGTVHQLKVVDEIKVEEAIKCASCDNQCWEYEPHPYDDDGFGPCIKAATSVVVARVYERHARAKAPPGAPFYYYTVGKLEPSATGAFSQKLEVET